MKQSSMEATGMPLDGIRVVDMTRFISGPFCAMYLGDLGADIIKIEHPTLGDGTRRWGSGPFPTDNPYYLSVNRNKRSVGLDLKQAKGVALLEELLAVSDVMIVNAIPGMLDEMGLSDDKIKQINPRLVLCQITGYGDKGPERQRGAFDFTIQAESGMMSLIGEPDSSPMKVGAPIMDVLTGMNAAIVVLAALLQRHTTGQTRMVSTSMLETALASMPNIVSDFLVGNIVPQRHGNAHPNLVPYEIYETQDRWIALGLGNEPQWQRFCGFTQRTELVSDPRFATNVDRIRNRKALNEHIRPLFKTQSLAWWIRALDAAEIPCAAVNTVPEVLEGEQARALGIVQNVPHPLYGSIKMARSPLNLDGQALPVRRPPPRLGEHTDQVLSELLGMDADALALLRQEKVLSAAL
jgi:crotonobetainyl-CoA:carnitine CoA-transferase CaiB-like acyl-CoA transferase